MGHHSYLTQHVLLVHGICNCITQHEIHFKRFYQLRTEFLCQSVLPVVHVHCVCVCVQVAKDGYGVSYIIQGDYVIFFHVSAFNSSEQTDATRFARLIKESLREIKDLFSLD